MIFTPTDIENIFAGHFKTAAAPIVEITYHGVMNSAYEINAQGLFYILKVYPRARYQVAIKEYHVLKKVRKSSSKVPKVRCVGDYKGFSYFIYEKIPGEALAFDSLSAENKKIISGQVAHTLKQFQGISFKYFGSLTENEATFSSWKDFLVHNVTFGLKDLQKANLDIDVNINVLEDYLQNFISSYQELPCGLVWSDFNRENIIIFNKQLSGLIDFEGCFYGDPLLSLGYLFAKEGCSDFFKSIRDEMQLLMDVDEAKIYFYTVLRLLRISQHLSEPMPGGQPRSPVLDYFKGINEALNSIKIKP